MLDTLVIDVVVRVPKYLFYRASDVIQYLVLQLIVDGGVLALQVKRKAPRPVFDWRRWLRIHSLDERDILYGGPDEQLHQAINIYILKVFRWPLKCDIEVQNRASFGQSSSFKTYAGPWKLLQLYGSQWLKVHESDLFIVAILN